MENIRNRVDIKLLTNKKSLKRYISKPNFKHLNIFSENLVSIHMGKTQVILNKPIYVGMSILDISKYIMYGFHYFYIKPKYGDKVKLCKTDTDSLLYEIKTEDFYKDISKDVKDKFDTSKYPKDHPSGIESGLNGKVVGKFKDEFNGKNIVEFVGLRPKMYSIKTDIKDKEEKDVEIKRCKGVKKRVVEKSITHDDYLNCLKTGKEQLRKMNNIRSYNHEIFTEEINKIALSVNDDKRYILEDGINTLTPGHYRIKKLTEEERKKYEQQGARPKNTY